MENERVNFGDTENLRREKLSPFADSPYEMPHVQQSAAPEPRPQPEPAPVQEAPIPAGKKAKSPLLKRVVAILLVVGLVFVGCVITAACVSIYWNGQLETLNKVVDNKLAVMQEQMQDQSSGSSIKPAVPQEGMTPGQVYEKNVKAVVAVSNQSLMTNLFGQVSETASSGTGFIISEDGYIVTNYHVVEGATTLKVITWDEKEHPATLVGGDATNDLAVLKIEETGLPYTTIGSSDQLAVGDQVAAIGNPLGELTSTLTVGYVSAKDRAVNTDGSYINMLQTDAAINSGNSGGPLFNMAGEVVGITTAKYSGTSNSGATIEGIGFAIPIDDVIGMIEDLISNGYIGGAYLGVMVRDVDASVAQMYGLPMGALVDNVTLGSCAAKAGVQPKDIIVNLGGYSVSSISELTRVLRRFEAGESTTITVFRGGMEVHLEITLDDKPQTTTQPTETEPTEPAEQPVQPDQDTDSWMDRFFPFFGFGG